MPRGRGTYGSKRGRPPKKNKMKKKEEEVMATKKPIYAKARPKRLGKPKSFNKKSKAYKSVKRKADKKFGKKVSLYKNIFISQGIKKYKARKKK